MTIEEVVHRQSIDLVVIVFELSQRVGLDMILGIEFGVQLLKFGKTLRRQLHGPVVRRIQTLWFWSEEGSELDVSSTDSQASCVLAGTATLHGG